jgi:HAD superfamily hydrolase (TIGR01490 family)
MSPATPKAPVIAFFDFDNTIISDDSQGLEIRYLMRQGKIRPADLVRIVVAHWLFKRHLITSRQMVRACVRIYKGRRPETVRERTAGLHETIIRPLYVSATRRRLAEHRRRGHACVILSASVPHLIEKAAEDLGIGHLVCTRLAMDDAGRFTGRPEGPVCVGAEKTRRARKLAAGLGTDLDSAWAYTDHHADTAFLRAVGHPVAVRPTRQLRRIALENGWPIVNGP